MTWGPDAPRPRENRPSERVSSPAAVMAIKRRGAGVDRQDGGADLHRLGLRGEVSHQGGAVESVGLGHPDQIESGLFHLGDLGYRLFEPAGVAQVGRDLHASPFTSMSQYRNASAVHLWSPRDPRAARNLGRKATALSTNHKGW